MTLIIIVVICLCIGIIMSLSNSWDIRDNGFFLTAISSVILVGLLVSILANRADVNGKIEQFHSIKQTLYDARERGDKFEKAAIQNKIIDANKWLSEQQYYNERFLDMWIPDEVMELERIK